MATIVVGDVHGNLAGLKDLLDQIRGDSARGNTIVFLGDYIDRGPNTKGCVDAILGFQREVRAEVICLLGNQDELVEVTPKNIRIRKRILAANLRPKRQSE